MLQVGLQVVWSTDLFHEDILGWALINPDDVDFFGLGPNKINAIDKFC